jgi:hypothetical protein
MLTGKGATGTAVPTSDIGLDPKCIVKRTPIMVGQVARVSTWQYDVDIDYIKSIGGVAKCFNPKLRSGTPDVGAYRAGTVTTVTPGSCVPPSTTGTGGSGGGGAGGRGGSGGSGGSAGTSGTGGTGATAGRGGTGGRGGAGGTAGGGMAGATGTGGSATGTGGGSGAAGTGQTGGAGAVTGTGTGGAVSGTGGTSGSLGGTSGSAGTAGGAGTSGAAGTGVSTGGTTTVPGPSEPGGCACDLVAPSSGSRASAALWLFAIGAAAIQRRRRARRK